MKEKKMTCAQGGHNLRNALLLYYTASFKRLRRKNKEFLNY